MSEKALDEGKFRELVLYIASRCEKHDRFGATKLRKLMFFVDFLCYEHLGESVTGADYVALEYGPVPQQLPTIQAEMVSAGEIALKKSGMQTLIIALRDPNLSRFSPHEIALIDRVCAEFEHHTATDVSEISHGMLGWQAARAEAEATPGKLVKIPYGTVFVESPELDPFEEFDALEMARTHGWAI